MYKLFVNTTACETETELTIIGELPSWVDGNLYRIGPGLFDLDENFTVNHWFDGAAILFKYKLTPNRVTCKSAFLKTDAYQKMITLHRPVYTEFGTPAYPDTTKSLFSRFINRVVPSELTDNVHGNIYAIGSDLYCASETCNIWRINPETLEAEYKVDLSKVTSVQLASSHPHTEPDGTIINMGSSFMTGLKYHIIKIDPNRELKHNQNKHKEHKYNFPLTEVLSSFSSTWKTMFSYAHSFSVTNKYIILIEQPLLINMVKLIAAVVKQQPLRDCFVWCGEREKTRFHVINKESGHILHYIFYAPPFFFLHTINAFEDGNHIVIDLVAYDDDKVLDSFYLNKLRQPEREQTEGQPSIRRYVLPLVTEEVMKSKQQPGDNLTTLSYTTSKSEKIDERGINVTPDYLLNPGFEIPSINKKFDARDYEFIYGSGLFEKNIFQNSLVKFSVKTKLQKTWVGTTTQFAGEAVFIPKPGSTVEDEGLIVSTVSELEPGKQNFLVVLDAFAFTEIARIEMNNVPLCPTIHGLWIPNETSGSCIGSSSETLEIEDEATGLKPEPKD